MPKNTQRPDRTARSPAERQTGRRLDAVPDRIDLRDWWYQPSLAPLPDTLVNCHRVPGVLDQGREGACTGFALAAVIDYLLAQQGRPHGVSPRMLYELARRYDEWPGEAYEGSSARGAIKGWVRHGVCRRATWPDDRHGVSHFSPAIAKEALGVPGGSYYRVKHTEIRDMHAAINETGILYVTLMVHPGWEHPGRSPMQTKPFYREVEYEQGGKKKVLRLPVISRQGRATSGHAVALVGYTEQGFIVQNSWGPRWGAGGFALLPYEDYLLHATDVWVAQLGVPVHLEVWSAGHSDTTAGLHRATGAIPLSEIRPYVINVGNDGRLSDCGDYWTTEQDLKYLFTETLPEKTEGWDKRRVMLYLHGGLNSERDSARRIVAMREVMLENRVYPLHVMWESDVITTAVNMLEDCFNEANRLAGGFLENLGEARDRVLELTVARPVSKLWKEMKENARLASHHPEGHGAMQLALAAIEQAAGDIAKTHGPGWEVHIVGHSAGAIFAAHLLPLLLELGLPVKSVQFLAPALRIDQFLSHLYEPIRAGRLPLPSLYVLSDDLERADSVGPYGKSLLYLISNALEGERGVPLLGMADFIKGDRTVPEIERLFSNRIDGRPALIVAGEAGEVGSVSSSRTHGGFDNDPATMNSVLTRILGTVPKHPFTERDLHY